MKAIKHIIGLALAQFKSIVSLNTKQNGTMASFANYQGFREDI
jgi:uncharacterized alkaline shock family protein YloU